MYKGARARFFASTSYRPVIRPRHRQSLHAWHPCHVRIPDPPPATRPTRPTPSPLRVPPRLVVSPPRTQYTPTPVHLLRRGDPPEAGEVRSEKAKGDATPRRTVYLPHTTNRTPCTTYHIPRAVYHVPHTPDRPQNAYVHAPCRTSYTALRALHSNLAGGPRRHNSESLSPSYHSKGRGVVVPRSKF
ncbi:hypothetical protein C8Q78DRAFT_471220 [Trametes maxima]|nr:hypothetical protein C8Q78DRAFT_471220 [Trametes maxima]